MKMNKSIFIGGYNEKTNLGLWYILKRLENEYNYDIVWGSKGYVLPCIRIMKYREGLNIKRYEQDVVVILSDKVRKEKKNDYNEYYNFNNMKGKEIIKMMGIEISNEILDEIDKKKMRLNKKIIEILRVYYTGKYEDREERRGYGLKGLGLINLLEDIESGKIEITDVMNLAYRVIRNTKHYVLERLCKIDYKYLFIHSLLNRMEGVR
jgi:hypothetical protein